MVYNTSFHPAILEVNGQPDLSLPVEDVKLKKMKDDEFRKKSQDTGESTQNQNRSTSDQEAEYSIFPEKNAESSIARGILHLTEDILALLTSTTRYSYTLHEIFSQVVENIGKLRVEETN